MYTQVWTQQVSVNVNVIKTILPPILWPRERSLCYFILNLPIYNYVCSAATFLSSLILLLHSISTWLCRYIALFHCLILFITWTDTQQRYTYIQHSHRSVHLMQLYLYQMIKRMCRCRYFLFVALHYVMFFAGVFHVWPFPFPLCISGLCMVALTKQMHTYCSCSHTAVLYIIAYSIIVLCIETNPKVSKVWAYVM